MHQTLIKVSKGRKASLGFAHIGIFAILAVVLLAGFLGLKFLQSSGALNGDTDIASVANERGCKFAGRVWSGTKCSTKCISGTYTVVGKSGYCTGYIDRTQKQAECNTTLHRKFVKEVGCAKVSVFQDKLLSGLGFAVDVPQCALGYRVYYHNNRDFCSKGGDSSAPAARDRSKPALLTATDTMKTSGQWESIDPRTGYSFSQEATYWTKSRTISDGLYRAKHGAGSFVLGTFGQVTKTNWRAAETFLKKQTLGNLYGVWRWTNDTSSDNLFNSYVASKKYYKMYTLSPSNWHGNCTPGANGFCQNANTNFDTGVTWGEFHARMGYNPNYFNSKADQDAWVKKYKVSVTPTSYVDASGGPTKVASIVIGSGHTYAAKYSFKYSDGTSPGSSAGTVTSKLGTSPFKLNSPLY